jgi:ATP-dependent 26S proteasome regulatory subunit
MNFDFKNQLLMLVMIKAYDVSFYTLLFLFSGFYLKDYSYTLYNSLCGSKEFKDTFKQSFVETMDSNPIDITNPDPFQQSESDDSTRPKKLNSKSSISIEIFLHKQNDTLAHSLLDYVTNKPNIQSISYSKNKFMLNHKNPILIETIDEVYIRLLSEKGSDEELSQVIEIYSDLLNVDELRSFLKKIEYNYTLQIQNKLGDKTYYFNDVSTGKINRNEYNKMPPVVTFTMKQFNTNRTFKNVIGPESRLIEKRVNFFMNNKQWYSENGIPYTFGLMLYGLPGCGKTSIIKALSGVTRRHIINIKLHKYVTKTQMENLFFNESLNIVQNGRNETVIIPIDQRIYLFEDLDADDTDILLDRSETPGFLKEESFTTINQDSNSTSCGFKDFKYQSREEKEKEEFSNEKLTLSCLLNLLDGVLEAPGRIVVMTTNYIEKLDSALIRPGRIDLICEFKKCTNQSIIEFIEMFYDIELNDECKNEIYGLTEYKITPAEMTKLMFENFEDFNSCLKKLKMQNI